MRESVLTIAPPEGGLEGGLRRDRTFCYKSTYRVAFGSLFMTKKKKPLVTATSAPVSRNVPVKKTATAVEPPSAFEIQLKIYEQAVQLFSQRKLAEARTLYLQHLPLIEFVGGQAYVAGTKALLTHMGMPAGSPRPPRLPLPPGQNDAARRLVAQFDLGRA